MDNNSNNLFSCSVCKLHYQNKPDMEKCFAWCSKYDSCNLEITANSEERKQKL